MYKFYDCKYRFKALKSHAYEENKCFKLEFIQQMYKIRGTKL